MTESYISFRIPGIAGKVLKTGSDCKFDPVSLLAVPDQPEFRCKNGRHIQAGCDGIWFVKRYRHRHIWDSLRYLLKKSRAVHCLEAACCLKKAGIDTPEVVAALRQKRNGLPVNDYLITRDISKEAVFADRMPMQESLIPEVTSLLVKLHGAGLEHGDVNLRNLYRHNSGRWGVIDLDGCRICKQTVGLRVRSRELARLASSYIKIKRYLNEPVSPEIPGLFAEAYRKSSGICVDTPAYRKRIQYLAERKRK